jgi:hypothetical protein
MAPLPGTGREQCTCGCRPAGCRTIRPDRSLDYSAHCWHYVQSAMPAQQTSGRLPIAAPESGKTFLVVPLSVCCLVPRPPHGAKGMYQSVYGLDTPAPWIMTDDSVGRGCRLLSRICAWPDLANVIIRRLRRDRPTRLSRLVANVDD